MPLFRTKPFPIEHFLQRHRRWVILAMLLALHMGLSADSNSAFQRVWLLVHFGLFLLWQPFVSTQRELRIVAVGVLLAIVVGLLYFLAGWMLVMWIAILIGIVSGKVFTSKAQSRNRFYFAAVLYLFAINLLWVVPVFLLEIINLPSGIRYIAMYVLPLAIACMTFLPYSSRDEGTTQIFDFFYSLLVFQLVVVLVVGSIALMRITENQYFNALLLAVVGFAGALMTLAVLWGPRAGFGGLRTYFSRYLMSVGMPFELWMRRIAALSEAQIDAERFLELAMEEVASMPWIIGGVWNTTGGGSVPTNQTVALSTNHGNLAPLCSGGFGELKGFEARFQYHDLNVAFYTEIRLSPALFLHLRLLAQVVAEFYEGKRREAAMKQNAYMTAVHETGAKLTHDIKNLLQSLLVLSSAQAAQTADTSVSATETAEAYTAMLSRQLPHLTKRLQATLDKFANPEQAMVNVEIALLPWWQSVQQRHSGNNIIFSDNLAQAPDLVAAAKVTAALLDTMLENCLDNALRKQQREPHIQIRVQLDFLSDTQGAKTPSLVELRVQDNGSAMNATIAQNLFRAPLSNTRGGGYGIGLYQVARQAAQVGYSLTLAKNENGNVVFLLGPG